MIKIAKEKQVTVQTLKRHRCNILKKTKSKNMMSLIADGLQSGWIGSTSITSQ
jgi:DNA-binding NarL/FixJ family response regulator